LRGGGGGNGGGKKRKSKKGRGRARPERVRMAGRLGQSSAVIGITFIECSLMLMTTGVDGFDTMVLLRRKSWTHSSTNFFEENVGLKGRILVRTLSRSVLK
jgi:hypothetical protein